MAERRVQLILEWLEHNPATFASVRDKINALGTATKRASRVVMASAKGAQEQKVALEATREEHAAGVENIMRSIPGYKMMENIQNRISKQQNVWSTRLAKFGDNLKKVGRHVGFYGWIISWTSRMAVRTLSSVFNMFTDLIKVSAEWSTSLESVVESMALLESQGMLTAETEKLLNETIDRLITDGPKFEALWKGFQSVLIAVSTIITSATTPALTDLFNELTKFLAREDVVELLKEIGIKLVDLADAIIPALPNLLKLVDIFLELAEALRPFFPILIPLIPLVMGLGFAMMALGPVFTLVGTILGSFTIGLGGIMFTLGETTIALGSFGLAINSTIIGFGPLLAIIAVIAAALINLNLVLGGSSEQLEWFDYTLAILMGPIGLIIVLWKHWNMVMDLWNTYWEKVRPVIEWFTNAMEGLKRALGGVGDFLGGLASALGKLCFKHATPMVEAFNDVIGQTSERAVDLTQQVGSLSGALRHMPGAEVGLGGAGGTHISISAPISIGSVSADMDLGRITDAVSKGISEALRRKTV